MAVMERAASDKLLELLGTEEIPGTPEEIGALRTRIAELAAFNGEDWVRRNREKLLEQWRSALNRE